MCPGSVSIGLNQRDEQLRSTVRRMSEAGIELENEYCKPSRREWRSCADLEDSRRPLWNLNPGIDKGSFQRPSPSEEMRRNAQLELAYALPGNGRLFNGNMCPSTSLDFRQADCKKPPIQEGSETRICTLKHIAFDDAKQFGLSGRFPL